MMKVLKATIPLLLLAGLLFTGIAFGAYQFVQSRRITLEDLSQTLSEIKIIDGNICETKEDIVKILVNKNDYENINQFANVQVSPDRSKMCFLGHSLVPIWLFTANADGSDVKKIDVAKNCIWSHNSQKIAYNNHTTDVSPVNVLVYDTLSAETKNLTKDKNSENVFRVYDLPQWSDNDKKITSKYTLIDFDNFEDKKEGTSVIDVGTGQMID